MAYCTSQDIIDQTGTSLDTTIIDRFITRSDAKIVSLCAAQGLSTPVDVDAINISILLSSAQVVRRHMTDGTLPEQYTAGELSEKFAPSKVIAMYETEAYNLLEKYFKENRTSIDYRQFRVVGRDGERVGSFSTMDSESEDET